ncbi:Receptor-like serine/threonine-protein kinase ALE2 [Sesamum alatum]|uniref:Receptor-like serine/threonine-protein kinase ALE2 n=1 Tax=Sesamum alatum TaxID=300844 RepID=A0AAE2CDU8_9LAMI|nr:Receptor-like serine/threonine-protein kinase ALE2 [Sesamum alatum]
MLGFLLPLLTLLHTYYGTPSQANYLSPSQLPPPSLARKNPLDHVTAASMSTFFTPFVTAQRRHFKYLSAAPAPSTLSQGPLTSPTGRTLPRHRHRRHKIRSHAVSPSPVTSPGCGQTCAEPLTSAPFGSPCMCVFPMRVRLLLGVSLYAIFPEVTELEIEVAAGTYLKQSQVAIIGASADIQNQERTVVDINLVPLGEKFDNTTAMLTYQRFLHKKVPLNRTLFGDYDIMYIAYPGLPSSPPSGILFGEAPTGSVGNQQFPITADFVGKKQKMNPRIVFVIAFSAFVVLVACCAAAAVLLKCRKARRSSNAVGPVSTPPMNKRSGIRSMLSSSPASSTSASLTSTMPVSVLSVKTFSLVEIEKATEKFSPKKVLGEGGFGRVYHGIMQDGTEVAVKLLTRDNQNGDREFIAEIEMLSRLHHRNLVKLIGICIEQRTRCLVYELVPNGSVESHLHGDDRSKAPLNWDARLKIALGAARGLAYLHEDSNPRVIHRDFKGSNVLLEDDFTPKVSDFGLAREATEGTHHISTRVMGTFGYVAPEYAMTGHLLVKSDVYSYGVVLLELLSGRKPVDMSQPPGQENLVTWARPLLTNREGLEQLVDPSLAGSYDFDNMAKVAAIASMCVHPEVTHRPFMGEVVQALKLIYNDTDETCADACSLKESSARESDFKCDFTQSDSSWWNAGGITPRLTYGQASSFITMEDSSGPLEGLENRPFSAEGGMALPIRHGNRSGPLRTVRSNRAFYRLDGSMSEHGGLLPKRAWNDGIGYEASF